MQVIDWLELQPPSADLEALRERLREALPLRRLCRLLIEITLRGYPWQGRMDLIPCYHPAHTYRASQRIALFLPDSENVRRNVWLTTHVKTVSVVENPVQGRFQVLTLDVHGRQIQMATGIEDASYPEPDLSVLRSEDRVWLVDWILKTYPLQAIVRRLIQKGSIPGRLAGETFLPEPVTAISPELLDPSFARLSPARPWISLEEIYRSLPDLASLEREAILGLLRASLPESPYLSLGGERWTTPELFRQLDRAIPCGLPMAPLPSQESVWTRHDQWDMAGYDRQFLPPEARRTLEKLGICEPSSQPEDAPWRPPDDSLQLPALSYFHITQAAFPVQSVMRLFAPGVKLVFVQFIHGDHEPFLLDQENGLLKAVHPEKLQSRIREEDIPAGTHLWLDDQGHEKYRIAPRLLSFKRRVPCKLGYVEQGQFHIAHTYISMMYEGEPSLFKAHLRFDEIEALFVEARRVDRSLREAMIYAIQEICVTDPDHRAHWLDIFNAVSLTRPCSPMSIALLLHTQPCFEAAGGGSFRYKPMQETIHTTRQQTTRLSRLWNDLLSDPVAPHPIAKQKMAVRVPLEVEYAHSPLFAPDPEVPVLLNLPETSLSANSYATAEEEPGEPVLLTNEVLARLMAADETATTRPAWRDSLENLFRSAVEVEDSQPASVSFEEPDSEPTAAPDMTIAAAHEETLTFSSPFRWEPRPDWVNSASPPAPPASHLVDPRHFVARPRIPSRPLHKQPFYRRFFFYLRRWLSGSSRKIT